MRPVITEKMETYVGPKENLNHLSEGLKGLKGKEWCSRLLKNLKGVTLPVLNRMGHAVHSLFVRGSWMNNKGILKRIFHKTVELSYAVEKLNGSNKHERAILRDLKAELKVMEKIINKFKEINPNENIGVYTDSFEKVISDINRKLENKEKNNSIKVNENRISLSDEDRKQLLEFSKRERLPTYKEMVKHDKDRKKFINSPESASMAIASIMFDIKLLEAFKKGMIEREYAIENDGKLKFKEGFKEIGYIYKQAMLRRQTNVTHPAS